MVSDESEEGDDEEDEEEDEDDDSDNSEKDTTAEEEEEPREVAAGTVPETEESSEKEEEKEEEDLEEEEEDVEEVEHQLKEDGMAHCNFYLWVYTWACTTLLALMALYMYTFVCVFSHSFLSLSHPDAFWFANFVLQCVPYYMTFRVYFSVEQLSYALLSCFSRLVYWTHFLWFQYVYLQVYSHPCVFICDHVNRRHRVLLFSWNLNGMKLMDEFLSPLSQFF